MKYFNKYIALREELWNAFEQLVRKGAEFPELIEVSYPKGENPEGLSITTDGDSWFYAKSLIANPSYNLHLGEDIIVATSPVTFMDIDDNTHTIEPDILDLYWLSELLDKSE
jgi:UTP-glucose-1-phosphate uridylyltransferase